MSENHPAPPDARSCPFCGASDLIVHTWATENDGSGIMAHVKCENFEGCGEAQGPMVGRYDSDGEAIAEAVARWNHRP